jgi:hypothetical protein
MTVVATSAAVRFNVGGVPAVDSYIRMTGRTLIQCCTYEDAAPILAIFDEHVRVSVTVPETSRVTGEDLQQGRALAEAVARYVAELEQRAATQDSAAGEAA